MELSFSDKSLRDLCYSEFLAQEIYGPELARSLKNRLADMAAVQTVSELFHLPGKPQEMACDSHCLMFLELAGGFKLVFKSGHVEERSDQFGKTDWARVRRIQLICLKESI